MGRSSEVFNNHGNWPVSLPQERYRGEPLPEGYPRLEIVRCCVQCFSASCWPLVFSIPSFLVWVRHQLDHVLDLLSAGDSVCHISVRPCSSAPREIMCGEMW